MTQATRQSFRFFFEHAGYVVGERAIGALALARAEAKAKQDGVHFDWQEDCDVDLGDHEVWCSDERANRQHDHEVLYCVAYKDCYCKNAAHKPHRDIVASLSGIIDPDRNYRRIVEAELALEALG